MISPISRARRERWAEFLLGLFAAAAVGIVGAATGLLDLPLRPVGLVASTLFVSSVLVAPREHDHEFESPVEKGAAASTVVGIVVMLVVATVGGVFFGVPAGKLVQLLAVGVVVAIGIGTQYQDEAENRYDGVPDDPTEILDEGGDEP